MGGTGCKVGIFKSSSESTDLERVYFNDKIKTSQTNAMDTWNEMRYWISEKLLEYSKQTEKKVFPGSFCIAAFGPMCLDKTSP